MSTTDRRRCGAALLRGDAAAGAKGNPWVPAGCYNVATTISAVTTRGGAVGVCGTCMSARGTDAGELVEGTHRGSLDELTDGVATSDRVHVF